MPTDDELRAIARGATGTGYYSGGVKALRAVYEAGREDAAREYQTRSDHEIGYEYGVLAAQKHFIAWADASPAVTWAGKLGLKERWEHRDDPEYQAMLKKLGESNAD